MKNTNRYIALALCFTLTLGVFAYRPPQAEALAGVDDAVVIGALLSAFAGGCGLIFSNNGMTSSELAQGLTNKWNEFKAAVLKTDTTFAGWLGYEDMDALLQAIVLSGGNALTVPRLVARKFADFTNWLKDNLGISAGGDSALLTDSIIFSNLTWTPDSLFLRNFVPNFGYSLSSSSLSLTSAVSKANDSSVYGWVFSDKCFVSAASDYTFNFSGVETHSYKAAATSSPSVGFGEVVLYVKDASDQTLNRYRFVESGKKESFSGSCTIFIPADCYFYLGIVAYSNVAVSSQTFQWSGSAARSSSNSFSVSNPAGVQTPDLAGEEETPLTISGVGAGAATIEDLLQQILARLQANTLAPTLEGVDTNTGGNTGTDEDAKPYLPYIPQIFGKIKELPGTLANIWESIKGIPAAIAEKIGAFFTTLWGWLQNIIDAITALPAAIAEKIKALFVPREGYAAEFVADITATYQGRMGLLTYPFTVLADFVGTVATLEEQEPVLRWDAVEWQNKTIIAAGEYNLKSAVSSAQMQTVYMIYKTVVSGMLVVAFLHLCYKKLKEVQRN
jgi:hypothetical protein